MSPEFGATSTLFPIDDETIAYLRLTGRSAGARRARRGVRAGAGPVARGRRTPDFDDLLTLDLASVEPSVAGPRRPQDRVPLTGAPRELPVQLPRRARRRCRRHALEGDPARRRPGRGVVRRVLPGERPAVVRHRGRDVEPPRPPRRTGRRRGGSDRLPERSPIEVDGERATIRTGSVAIAAITSCTNTSNPTVMVGAALLARNAVRRGLRVPPTVKTSLAPGSKAVTAYLAKAGLMEPLETLGFALAGYGCTTCIGNSGPLDEPIAKAIEEQRARDRGGPVGQPQLRGPDPSARARELPRLAAARRRVRARRPGRHRPHDRAAGHRRRRPARSSSPTSGPRRTRSARSSTTPSTRRCSSATYASVFEGDDRWQALPIPAGDRYDWDPRSTYVARPPYFDGMSMALPPASDIVDARALAILGDSVTTDHISPAGSIAPWSPAGEWLQERNVPPLEFNSYGARRGHHEVLIRGTFGNIRLRNALAERTRGPVRRPPARRRAGLHLRHRASATAKEGVPLIVVAGKEYGSGSSRDWAAKGPLLLGVRAVIAEIVRADPPDEPRRAWASCRSQFLPGENLATLGLTGRESFTIRGVAEGLAPRSRLHGRGPRRRRRRRRRST